MPHVRSLALTARRRSSAGPLWPALNVENALKSHVRHGRRTLRRVVRRTAKQVLAVLRFGSVLGLPLLNRRRVGEALAEFHRPIDQIDVVGVLECASGSGQVPREGVHAEPFCELEAVPLEALRPQIADAASFPNRPREIGHDPAAILQPAGTDLAGVQLVLLPADEAVADKGKDGYGFSGLTSGIFAVTATSGRLHNAQPTERMLLRSVVAKVVVHGMTDCMN